MKYIRNFSTLTLQDIPLVGGKNAALGEFMSCKTHIPEILIPNGFAITIDAYWDFITENNLYESIKEQLSVLEQHEYDSQTVKRCAFWIRKMIEEGVVSPLLYNEVLQAYTSLSSDGQNSKVAVRSSATAEDLPNASFAGQQDSFLQIQGIEEVITSYKKCIASLFTERAILYRKEKGFDHFSIGMSVGVQLMVRADVGAAGVLFTLEPETGFKDLIVINAAHGLGSSLVQGTITPDEYHVFKPFVFHKKCITKKMVGHLSTTFCLSDDEILFLSKLALAIEAYYRKITDSSAAVDIEWAKDGVTGHIYIVQVRPETIHSVKSLSLQQYVRYNVTLNSANTLIASGHSIGQKAVTGRVKCIEYFTSESNVAKNDIIVTTMTDPDWIPLLKKCAGVVTVHGGRTCHAAIVSRELGIPAIVGVEDILQKVSTGDIITLDCTQGMQGYIYSGACTIEEENIIPHNFEKQGCNTGLIIADPDHAYKHSLLPVDEVGLVRLEFMITHNIQAHPMALLYPEKITNSDHKIMIEKLMQGYESGADFFMKKLAEGVATIAAAFYPRPVLVRFSDFKSNEYRNLIGGSDWEPYEENPMLGLRGAARYYHPLYHEAFLLECKALEYVRNVMGFTNVNVMVPFVRTLQEGQKVKDILASQGLVSQKNGLQIFMMCELPSNVVLLEQFSHIFDGFSIGSNDLTQTVLAVDRDSGMLANLFKEDDAAVVYMIKQAIEKAHMANKKIGICGQAPSDNPAFAQMLLECKIDSISLNVDSVFSFLQTKTSLPHKVVPQERVHE